MIKIDYKCDRCGHEEFTINLNGPTPAVICSECKRGEKLPLTNSDNKSSIKKSTAFVDPIEKNGHTIYDFTSIIEKDK